MFMHSLQLCMLVVIFSNEIIKEKCACRLVVFLISIGSRNYMVWF